MKFEISIKFRDTIAGSELGSSRSLVAAGPVLLFPVEEKAAARSTVAANAKRKIGRTIVIDNMSAMGSLCWCRVVSWDDYLRFYQEKKKTWMVVERKFRNVFCILVIFLLMILILVRFDFDFEMMIQMMMMMDGELIDDEVLIVVLH